jgi:hypothetical protein
MADSYSPPEGVRAEARRALKWIEEGHAGGGFTDTGRKRASDLARGASVSLKTIRRMNSFLARHEVDKQGKGFSQGSDGYPSAGRVSWAAWGGDAGKSWAAKILASVEKSVDAIASDPMQMDLDLATGWAEGEIAWDELPQNVKDAIDEVMAEDYSEEVEGSVGVVVKADEQTELLHKADAEHRFTLGPWYIPNRYDAHGEWTDADELQKALWEYVRTGDRDIRLQHNRDIVAGEWLEAMSFPVPVSIGMQKSGESKQVTYPSGTVFLGVQWKPWAWEMVKEGKIRGFSIGGAAARIEMEMPADAIAKASFDGDRSAAGRYAAEQRWQRGASSGQKAYGVLDEVATRVMGRVAQARARKAAQVTDRGEQSLFGRIKYVFSREYTNPEPLARKWVKEAIRQSRERDRGDKQFESVVDLPKGRQAILSGGRLITVGKTVDRDAIKALMRQVVKQQPTSSQVHVDTVMGGKRKKKKRPSRDEVLKREGKKPINVPTLKKSRNVPTDMKLYSRVKSEAKKKFDVYPSAYANAWLVREYKKRGGRYKIEKAVSFGGDRSAAGTYAANQRWQGKGHVADRYVKMWHKEFGRGPIRYPQTEEGRELARIMPSLNTHCDLDALAADYRATGTNPDSISSPALIYKHLSEERRAVWNGIVKRGEEGVPKGTNPEGSRVFVKAGGGGAGKSSTPQIEGINIPTTGEKDSPRNAVMSNADDIKEQLPEYQQAALSKTNTMTKTPKGKELPTGVLMDRRASMNHEESAQLAVWQVTAAIKGGKDVIVDGTMDNGVEKALGKLASYREGGAAEVHMIAYSCDTNEAEERAYRRSKETGRSVPSEALRKAHIKVSTNFPEYLEKGRLDSATVVDTNLNDDGSKRPATKIFEYKPSGGIKILNPVLYERFLSKRNDSTKSGINPVQLDKLIQDEIVRSEG